MVANIDEIFEFVNYLGENGYQLGENDYQLGENGS